MSQPNDSNPSHSTETASRSRLSPRRSSRDRHPQKELFGGFAAEARVGVNPNASIASVNPRWAGVDFGDFRVPALDTIRMRKPQVDYATALNSWALSTEQATNARSEFVPPETGRAVLLAPSTHPIYRDILVKGTGLVERFTRENKLRFASRGFNGLLEMSEAERDLVNTEILERAGVVVSAGIGVIDHRRVETYDDFTAWTGNYVRGFRVQTRISNLFELDAPTMKAAIDDAIERLGELVPESAPTNYVEYFRAMVAVCARNVAILQAIGFTQDSFHYGQVTLCGELTDLGIGSFDRPTERGVVNTLHPWFRYERQPILMLNMLYKTHAVKAEPVPVALARDSRARREQQTLFGAIERFAPEAAAEIEAMRPDRLFWEIYERAYRAFDITAFRRDVLGRIERYYDWTPETMLAKLPDDQRTFVAHVYEESLRSLDAHYELQEGPWRRRGATSLHKQVLYGSATRRIVPHPSLDFSGENIGFDVGAPAGGYLRRDGNLINAQEDLSWKPESLDS